MKNEDKNKKKNELSEPTPEMGTGLDKQEKQTKTTETKRKPVYENKEEDIKDKKSFQLYSFIFVMAAFTGIFIYLKYNVKFDVDSGIVVMIAALSIMTNIIILGIVFITGIGKSVLKRFKQRIMYHRGNYLNSLFITKNGTMKEIFKKVDENGKVKIDSKPYTRNPSLLFNFNKIPTNIHKEDTPDPLNPWQDKIAGDLSCTEIDTVMNSADAFDFKQWLNKNKMIIAYAIFIVVIASGVSAYFGYQTWTLIRDGNALVQCANLDSLKQPIIDAVSLVKQNG